MMWTRVPGVRNASLERGSVVRRATAVRTRYEHIAAGWRRAAGERRAGLLGELELLALELPAVVQPEDPDRAERSSPCGRPSGS